MATQAALERRYRRSKNLQRAGNVALATGVGALGTTAAGHFAAGNAAGGRETIGRTLGSGFGVPGFVRRWGAKSRLTGGRWVSPRLKALGERAAESMGASKRISAGGRRVLELGARAGVMRWAPLAAELGGTAAGIGALGAAYYGLRTGRGFRKKKQ